MPRFAFILFLAVSILCSGCRTYSPEVQATLEKYRMIKQGMTRSQVYAILPQQDIFFRPRAETEVWHFSTAKGDIMTNFTLEVTFGADGRVQKVTRDIEDMHLGLMTK
jgi:outer membrane protein assembly factor BamE (lipoprotein component of BamABCDE complex)